MVYKKTGLLTFQPVYMEFQAIFLCDIIVASSFQKTVLREIVITATKEEIIVDVMTDVTNENTVRKIKRQTSIRIRTIDKFAYM